MNASCTCIPSGTEAVQGGTCHGIIEWFRLEENLKPTQSQTFCHRQSCHPLDQATQGTIQPGLWTPPGLGHLQPLWVVCASASLLSEQKVFHKISPTFPLLCSRPYSPVTSRCLSQHPSPQIRVGLALPPSNLFCHKQAVHFAICPDRRPGEDHLQHSNHLAQALDYRLPTAVQHKYTQWSFCQEKITMPTTNSITCGSTSLWVAARLTGFITYLCTIKFKPP